MDPPPTSASPSDPGRIIALALATAIPLACYVATASAHGYWLGSGDVVAASVDLAVGPAPGQPLVALLGAAAALVPLGPLPLRVAIASGVVAAIACGFLYTAVERTVHSCGVPRRAIAAPLAVAATWLVGTSWAWWFQAVRPDVFAVQTALTCVVLERVVALEQAWPLDDPRPLYAAGLALGLALANHHFLAVLAVPAMAPTLARMRGARGGRPLRRTLFAVLVGVAALAYVPIRGALATASPRLEHAGIGSWLGWMLHGKLAAQASHATESVWTRALATGQALAEELHWITLLGAGAAVLLVWRAPRARRVGFVWMAAAVIFAAAPTWLGFLDSRAAVRGALLPAAGAVAALAAASLAILLRLVGAGDTRLRIVPLIVALGVALTPLLPLPANARRASLADFAATDAFAESLRRGVPSRAVIVAHNAQTMQLQRSGRAVEALRPDVRVVPMRELPHPGVADALVARAPELQQLLRGYFLEGELRQPDLQSLAARRPLLVEMDPDVPPALYDTMVPHGLYHQVLADGATDADEQLGAETQRAAWSALSDLLGPPPHAQDTNAQLGWRHYTHALYYAGFGDLQRARAATEKALRRQPQSDPTRRLWRALASHEGDGELDLRALLKEGGAEPSSTRPDPE